VADVPAGARPARLCCVVSRCLSAGRRAGADERAARSAAGEAPRRRARCCGRASLAPLRAAAPSAGRAAQLYAGGELLGGCDIVDELAADGTLRSAVDEALAAAPAPAAPAGAPPAAPPPAAAAPPPAPAKHPSAAPNGGPAAGGAAGAAAGGDGGARSDGGGAQRLHALVAEQPVMLFMKARQALRRLLLGVLGHARLNAGAGHAPARSCMWQARRWRVSSTHSTVGRSCHVTCCPALLLGPPVNNLEKPNVAVAPA